MTYSVDSLNLFEFIFELVKLVIFFLFELLFLDDNPVRVSMLQLSLFD